MPVPFAGRGSRGGPSRRRAAPPLPPPPPVGMFGGGAGSRFEDFKHDFGLKYDGWNTGEWVGHLWGSYRDRASHDPSGIGTVTIGPSAPANGADEYGTGLMTIPTDGDKSGWGGGMDTGLPNGLFEIRGKFRSTTGSKGGGSGPAFVIWPVSNQWPGPEIDIGEIDDAGFYMATHYRTWDGKDGFDLHRAVAGFDWWNWHTYAAFLQTDRITYYIDGEWFAENTAHPAPDYDHGGEDHALGIMNRSWETHCDADFFRWTPEATILARIAAGEIGTGGGGGGTTRSIRFDPLDPGTRAAGPWPTKVKVAGIPNIDVVVANGADQNWSWVGSPARHAVPANGEVSVSPELTRTGQLVKALDAADHGFAGQSGQVTIAAASPAAKSFSLSPRDPGIRSAGVWNTTLTVTGMPRVVWVVANDDWSWVDAGVEVAVPANGQVAIAANFTATGQRVRFHDPADAAFTGNSGQVTIA